MVIDQPDANARSCLLSLIMIQSSFKEDESEQNQLDMKLAQKFAKALGGFLLYKNKAKAGF